MQKVRILTRWADSDNEQRLLELARERSFTTWTDGDGMTIVRIKLPPSVAKPVIAAVDTLVQRIAAMPADESAQPDPPADASDAQSVADDATQREQGASADAPVTLSCGSVPQINTGPDLAATVHELRQQWQPAPDDDWLFPSKAQQRADAFMALVMGLGVDLTTEVVLHVRGDGVTFDDGTPTTDHAVIRQLSQTLRPIWRLLRLRR